jgi:hypothetical protein
MIGIRISESGPGLFAPGWMRGALDAAKEPKKPEPKPGSMTEEDAPIGIVDGQVITVEKDAPPWKPTIVDDAGNVVELGDDD